MKFSLLFLTVFLTIFSQSFGLDRYIFSIVQYDPNIKPVKDETFRCYCTAITKKHVVIPATCADATSPYTLGVQVAIGYLSASGSGYSSTLIGIEKIFKHPDFTGNFRESNVAVVLMDGSFNEEGVVFRKLGGIESGLSYTLFGWGQEMTNHVVSTLTVYNSGSCDSNFPQVFCSTFTVANARSCDAGLGSPLIAVDDSMAGFLISNAKMCTISGDKFVLSFISLEGFQEWIEKTSGAQKNVKISLMMIFVAFVTSKLFL